MKKSDGPSKAPKARKKEGKLNFPVFTGSLPSPSRHLSMDEYLDFLEFCLEFHPDRGKVHDDRKRKMVGTRFALKD
ncbi:MAG: hypothetical protein HYU34_00165 [Candidatus Omnitrophica bacterium]|nr:hypothetical protein [Candidatus Omnitrophota bacterium]